MARIFLKAVADCVIYAALAVLLTHVALWALSYL